MELGAEGSLNRFHYARHLPLSVLAAALLIGCGESDPAVLGLTNDEDAPPLSCTIPIDQIFDGGVGLDGIPALTDPPLVAATDPGVEEYLRDGSRVIGLRFGSTYVAVPHNILWWHEIVNLDIASSQVAVTYCPLTGSGIVFDRGSVGGAELGVSGLLFQNNLVLYDRREGRSLFPQMMRQAACGPSTGLDLRHYPSQEMTWEAWKGLHPETLVPSPETGYARDYRLYPYGSYEDLRNLETLYPQDIDTSRPPKERVLAIPQGDTGGVAFPFGELEDPARPLRVIEHELATGPVVVLWDGDARAAVAFHRDLDGTPLDLTVVGDTFVDLATGSVWSFEGVAVGGPLAGARLRPVQEAFVAFWFAWKAFQPETTVWVDGP